MFSLTHRFLFVHVPKTAGNAIQGALSAYADDQIVTLAAHQDGVERFEVRSSKYNTVKHSSLSDYQREYGGDLLERLFKFTCVRNPWDRCISHYFSPHRGNVTWDRVAFLQFVAAEVKPLQHYLGRDASADRALSKCLDDMNAVIRYESLQSDFDAVCASIGIPLVVLPRRNASQRGNYLDYYDTESAAHIGDMFAQEIQHFGYSIPGYNAKESTNSSNKVRATTP